MLRKLLTILASVVYFILTIGISFNVHYCEGEVKSISVFEGNETCCTTNECNISCTIPDNCCDDEEYLLQFFSDNQLLSIRNISFHQYVFILNKKLIYVEPILEKNDLIKSYNLDLPPQKNEYRYIQNCSLLFYA